MPPIYLLALLWIAWCFLHSFLISGKITAFAFNRIKNIKKYYRLLYSIFSLITLIPIIAYSREINSQPFFTLQGIWAIPRYVMSSLALLLFAGGLKNYNFLTFIGIKQIIDNKQNNIALSHNFKRGLNKYIRHPWYIGTILIIWARNITAVTLIENVILTVYIITGTILEERKLIKEFGDNYRQYTKDVGIYFPKFKKVQ